MMLMKYLGGGFNGAWFSVPGGVHRILSYFTFCIYLGKTGGLDSENIFVGVRLRKWALWMDSMEGLGMGCGVTSRYHDECGNIPTTS
ncbi:hypothetical protein VTL71DRAFT_5880 [Oculimacula yallundae]|uniref:Uncharacterized protein n=1 Tax=Oculimacula yallundae TaxID=86028 RepID=A0ABR4BYS7_9HELO